MPGEALGVGHDQVVGRGTEGLAQSKHLGRGAAPACRRIGLVRDENQLFGHGVPFEAVLALGGRHQFLHHPFDVRNIQTRAVVGAVGEFGAQDLDHAAHAAFAHAVLGLDDQRARAHAHEHAVAAAIERQGRALDSIFGGGSARGQESRAHPFHQMVRGQLVGADHDHAPAAPQTNPILGHRNGHGRGCTSRIDLRVRSANPEHLGELGVAHGEHLEDEAPVELELGLLFACLVETRDFARKIVEAGKGRGEDHAGLVGHAKRQAPAVGQVTARRGTAVVAYQRNAGVAQGLDTGRDGERGCGVEDLGALLGHAELLDQIESALAAGQADDLVDGLDGLQARLAHLALVQAHDVLAQHALAHLCGHGFDEGFTGQDAIDVAVVEHTPAFAGQAQADARHHDRTPVRRGRGGRATTSLIEGHALLEETRKKAAQALEIGLARRRGWTCVLGAHGGDSSVGRCEILARGRATAARISEIRSNCSGRGIPAA